MGLRDMTKQHHEQNRFLDLWLTLGEMDHKLQRAITAVFIPCHCLRMREMDQSLTSIITELRECCEFSVFGMSVEEKYPGLFHELVSIHDAVEDIYPILHSSCPKNFGRLYHALINFRSCLLYYRWREGWFYAEEMLQMSYSVFSMFNPLYHKMATKDVLNHMEWNGIARLIKVAVSEWEFMHRSQNLIHDLKEGQIASIIQQSVRCLNEMEYAASVESKNHFQRNYETLLGLYKPWFAHSTV
jgi:hypothetical protein